MEDRGSKEVEPIFDENSKFKGTVLWDLFIGNQLPGKHIKQQIKHIINRKILEDKCNLEEIIKYIEDTFDTSLKSFEVDYIEKKYIKCCSDFWLKEITNAFIDLTDDRRRHFIKEILNTLENIQCLKTIPNHFQQLEYYELLIKHYKFVSKEYEKSLLIRFKKQCLQQIVDFSDSFENEVIFLENFVKFLTTFKNIEDIKRELQLEDFCNDKLTFDKFLEKIINIKEIINIEENVILLQESAKCLQGENYIFLIDKLKEVIGGYIKPVEIVEKHLDNRLVIEVTGKNIVISEILVKLEFTLNNSNNELKIEEVRFVGADIIHIDADLNKNTWHGKNIVIFAETIKIYDKRTWNVSGNDSDNYIDNADTGKDGRGLNGSDGLAGESGGNVLIFVKEVFNSKNFTIVSHGGNGGKGQNGGKGADGQNGKGIEKKELLEDFPPPAKLIEERRTYYVRIILKSIERALKGGRNSLDAFDIFLASLTTGQPALINVVSALTTGQSALTTGQSALTTEQSALTTGWNARYSLFRTFAKNTNKIEDLIPKPITITPDTFVEAETNEGIKITFSYQCATLTRACQAFLIYIGSAGQPGLSGGEYGLGGEGGYSGNIQVENPYDTTQVFAIIKSTQNGKEGEKGKWGDNGKTGNSGWDMGYMDYSCSSTWPKFFGTDKCSKLKLKFYNTSSDDRVLCPYREYKGEKDIYVEIKATTITNVKNREHEQEHKLQNETEKNKKRQQHAQATRKKNILRNSILNCYYHNFISQEINTLQNLQCEAQNIKQIALETIIDNQQQQGELTKQSRVKHQLKFNSHQQYDYDTNVTEYKYDTNVTDDTNVTENKIKKKFQNLPINNKYKKYNVMFTVLEKIAMQLPPYQEIAYNIDLTPENTASYLFESKNNYDNISHPDLKDFGQYFSKNIHEQYNNIFRFCEEENQRSGECCEILRKSLITFVLEVGTSTDDHFYVQKYYEEYIKFYNERNCYLNIFKSELFRPRHEKIVKAWNSIDDKYAIRNPDQYEKILGDKFLIALFKRFNDHYNLEYDWDECCNDENTLKEYEEYIKEKGPLSPNYRELLANIFKININIYSEDENNMLLLRDCHNPSSNKVVHILFKNNEFLELEFDKNYCKLRENRKKQNHLYAKILARTERFKSKKTFHNYLKKKRFLNNNNVLDCESDGNYRNELNNIEKIIKHFPDVKKQELKERLEKITSQYIGRQGILYYILKRFEYEGIVVHYHELCYLINSIMASSVEDEKELNIFCWIVAAYPQKYWIVELTLLQLENFLRRPLRNKSKVRAILTRITNKNILLLFNIKLKKCQSISITSQCLGTIIYLLSKIPNETINLERLELSEWPFALREKYWINMLSQLISWKESNELFAAFSYYILFLENIFGSNLLNTFLKTLKRKKHELSPETLTNILCNFYNERWNLSKVELDILTKCNINEWIKTMEQKYIVDDKERDITQLIELIESNNNTSEQISNNLTEIGNAIRSISNHKYEIAKKPIAEFTENDITDWIKKCNYKNINKKNQNLVETVKEMLALIDIVIEQKRQFKLRDTQKLTILTLLTNDKNVLAQVSTGEGKSLIVVAAAIIKALFGEKVHIITSSSVLAKRDAEENKDIFNVFGINVFHNCSEDIDKRKEAYSGNQVVYGDLSNFQRDYLLDKFYNRNILGDHNFNNVIVDEVDSMLLDKGHNMLYLSHDLAGFDKLESVYIYIWQWINRPAVEDEEITYTFNSKAIKTAILKDLYAMIEIKDMGKLGSELNENQKNIIWERLIRAEILDDQGKLLQKSIDDKKLNTILSSEFNNYTDRLSWFLNECIARRKFINIPNFLRPFVEQHLESWINSAVVAYFMKPGQDYVVDVDRSGASSDCNPTIIILDRDTGTDQANSQWDEALHQFLQLKHGCKLSLQSLKAVFISNVSFLKLYENLYGLTGTLGSKEERNLLEEIHKIEYVIIPTAKIKQFYEDINILCSSTEEWRNQIYSNAVTQTKQKNRSVLIICETINDVEFLYKYFKRKGETKVQTYTRDYENFDIGQSNKKLGQGIIILATNLAGRGTDIRITEKLREAGGLHVFLTYLPDNIRIEQQAFGRAARNGGKGSGQLIIMDRKIGGYQNSKIFDLKRQRNDQSLHRLSDMKLYYNTTIVTEEYYFKEFKEKFQQLDDMLSTSDFTDIIELKEVLLQSCLCKWALWLDNQNYNGLDNSINGLILQLENLKCNNFDDLLCWVKGNPFQMIKFGKYLCKIENYKEAIITFDKVIEQENLFSEAAHYYKAFALAKMMEWNPFKLENYEEAINSLNKVIVQENLPNMIECFVNETVPKTIECFRRPENSINLKLFKKELRETEKLLEQHISFAIKDCNIISNLKKNYNQSIMQIDAYEKQKENMCNLFRLFQRSINDILGYPIMPDLFINNNISQEQAENIYNSLVKNGILKSKRVQKNISDEELKTVSYDYGISSKELKQFLFAKSGTEVIDKNFQKALKEDIKLPSREVFWKLLIEHKILIEEVKYIIVDNDKLKKIDPKLLNSFQKLDKQILELNNEIIFLYPERIEHKSKKNNEIFKKNDFINSTSIDLYKKLKKLEVLTFNKTALIDQSKINNITFSDYDSFTLEDFTNINITNSEAEKILKELVNKEILKIDDKCPNVFRLQIEFDENTTVDFPSFPVYEGALRNLLLYRFTYRIAFQKFVKWIAEKKSTESKDNKHFRIQLMCKPHQMLFFELQEKRIITPVKFKNNTENLKNKIESIIEPIIMQNYNLNFDDELTIVSRKDLLEIIKPVVNDLWKEKAEHIISILKHAGNSVENIIIKIIFLWKNETKNIISNLEKAEGSLIAINDPNCKLKPLTECFEGNFGNINEVQIIFLNGLSDLLQLEERKYTGTMIFNTTMIMFMGMGQIVAGAAIQLFSMGIMTHVGAALLNEGINDIQYAYSAVSSGYCSWKDYWQYKFNSLIFSFISAGIGMYFSGSCMRSAFGEKLCCPGYRYNGVQVSKMCGFQLIETAGTGFVKETIGKHIATKVLKGIFLGVLNAGVDKLIENYIQGICEKITDDILSTIADIFKTTESIYNILHDAYMRVGRAKAQEIVDSLTNTVLNKLDDMEKFLCNSKKIINCVVQGLSEAYEKTCTPSDALFYFNKIFSKSVHILRLSNIGVNTYKFLKNLKQEIENQLKKEPQMKINDDLKDRDEFISEVIQQWKLLLCGKVGEFLAEITGSIIKDGVECLGKYAGKFLKEAYQSYKEKANFELFEKNKEEYHVKLQENHSTETKDYITEKYHADLLKLLMKTRSTKLFAAIVRENIPMDMTCVEACAKVIHGILKRRGIRNPAVNIKVIGDNGIIQTIHSDPEAETGRVIELTLKNNHFQFSEDNNLEQNNNNNCLYFAARHAIPELGNFTQKEFRDNIANYIEHDPVIEHHISQGWHRIPLHHGAVGGKKDIEKSAKDLKEELKTATITYSQTSISDETSGKHGEQMHLWTLKEDMNERGWQGPALNAVELKENKSENEPLIVVDENEKAPKVSKLVMLDNRRVVAASFSNLDKIPICVFDEDEILPDNLAKQYGACTAKEAYRKRMAGGSFEKDICKKKPGFHLTELRIRTKEDNVIKYAKHEKEINSFLKDLSDEGYKFGKKRKITINKNNNVTGVAPGRKKKAEKRRHC